MIENDPEPLERGLRRLKPARPPEEFLLQLAQVPASALRGGRASAPARSGLAWPWRWLRWLAPAAAVALLAAVWLVWRPSPAHSPAPRRAFAGTAAPVLKADAVEIDKRLVAAFDTVAKLPGGEPVRFRCREWDDRVIMRDSTRGIVFEQRVPRMEIVPISIETY